MWPDPRWTASTSSQCEITHGSCHAPTPPVDAPRRHLPHHLLPPGPTPPLRGGEPGAPREARAGPRSPVAWTRSARTARERSVLPPCSARSPEPETGVCRLRAEWVTCSPQVAGVLRVVDERTSGGGRRRPRGGLAAPS